MKFTFKIERSAGKLRGAIIGKPAGPAPERAVAFVSDSGVMTFATNRDSQHGCAWEITADDLYRFADCVHDAKRALEGRQNAEFREKERMAEYAD